MENNQPNSCTEQLQLGRIRAAWYVDGRGFDPHVQQHSFVKFGHEIIFNAILSLPLIQEVLVNCLGGLHRNSVDRLTDRVRNDLKIVDGP